MPTATPPSAPAAKAQPTPSATKAATKTPTGDYHYGARYYNPGIGPWTQLDPSGLNSGYDYSGSDPINFSDPTGTINVEPDGGCYLGDCTFFLDQYQGLGISLSPGSLIAISGCAVSYAVGAASAVGTAGTDTAAAYLGATVGCEYSIAASKA